MGRAKPEKISLRNLSTLEEMEWGVELQARIWGYGRDGRDHPYPSRALFSLSESGGLVSGAFCGDELVGFAVAWLGRSRSPSSYYLHSQLLGVLPRFRRLGIGFKLKLQQRTYALESGLTLIRWTFDPLQSVNARFNLQILGAVAQTYSENHYGAIRSQLAGDLPSDRMWAEWHINSPRVTGLIEKRQRYIYGDLPSVLRKSSTKRSRMNLRGPADLSLQLMDPELLVEIPVEFDLISRIAPDLASEWRSATRAVLTAYLSQGYIIDDCFESTTGDDSSAFYHLSRRTLDQVLEEKTKPARNAGQPPRSSM